MTAARLDRSATGILTIALLTGAWCALWGDFSVANLLSGLLVAAVAVTMGTGRSGPVRLVPLLRLIGFVARDMVSSTISVIREVVTPTDFTEEAVIAIDLPADARHHSLLLFVAITVTPGTAVVAAEHDASRLYVHVLHAQHRADVEAHVRRLARLAERALPAAADRAGVKSR